MAQLQVTLECGATAIRVVGEVVKGWQSAKDGYGFFGMHRMGFAGDRVLQVILQVRARPNRYAALAKVFPETLNTSGGSDSLNYKLNGSRLEVYADMNQHIEVLERANKLGIKWLDVFVGHHGIVRFYLMLLVSFTVPNASGGRVTWEHGVLPFLPGGQFESNRRRH